jgi:hypothetical protein
MYYEKLGAMDSALRFVAKWRYIDWVPFGADTRRMQSAARIWIQQQVFAGRQLWRGLRGHKCMVHH